MYNMAMISTGNWINRTTRNNSRSKARKSRAKRPARQLQQKHLVGNCMPTSIDRFIIDIIVHCPYENAPTPVDSKGEWAHQGRSHMFTLRVRNDLHTRIPPVDSSKLSTSTLASKDVNWSGVALWNNLLRLAFWTLWALRPYCSSPNSFLPGVLNSFLRRVCPRLTSVGSLNVFLHLSPIMCLPPVWSLLVRWCNVSKQSRHSQIVSVSALWFLLKSHAWAHNWTKWCHGLLLSLPTFIGLFFTPAAFLSFRYLDDQQVLQLESKIQPKPLRP